MDQLHKPIRWLHHDHRPELKVLRHKAWVNSVAKPWGAVIYFLAATASSMYGPITFHLPS